MNFLRYIPTRVGGTANMPQLQDELCTLGVDCLDDGLPCLYLLLGVDAWRLRVPAIAFSHKSHPRPHIIFRIKLTFDLQKTPNSTQALWGYVLVPGCMVPSCISRPLASFSNRPRSFGGTSVSFIPDDGHALMSVHALAPYRAMRVCCLTRGPLARSLLPLRS